MKKTILVLGLLLLSTIVMAKDYGDYEAPGWGLSNACVLEAQQIGWAGPTYCRCVGGEFIGEETDTNGSICIYKENEYRAWFYFWYMLRLSPYCENC